MADSPQRGRLRALLSSAAPFFAVLGIALALFALADWLDRPDAGLRSPLRFLEALNGEAAMESISSSAEVVAGVLAIVITVVAIVVELAANRYTHHITQLFVREPVNALVMGFFVLTTILCVWVSAAGGAGPTALLPHAGFVLCMAMVTVCLLLLIPYFAFVFRFLSPIQVIGRIRHQGLDAIRRARTSLRPGTRASVIEVIEELESVARGAREHSDRAIAMAAIDALADLLRDYTPLRRELPEAWFRLDGALARDPDFVSMDPAAMADIIDEQTWLETKVLRRYLGLFSESLGVSRDISHLVALKTRQLSAETAQAHPALLGLSIRFFNSYLRAAINARDQRTAYYVFQQYRLLCEAVLQNNLGHVALEIAEYLCLYGKLGYSQGQPFLLEVVAYDVSVLVQCATEAGRAEAGVLLDRFLEIDRESGSPEQEERLRGVRRAQVQLAAFFLERGDSEPARRIYEDMKDERPERLAEVRSELLAEERAQFWEFTDRGVNFSYLPPAQRAQLETFFGWFGERTVS